VLPAEESSERLSRERRPLSAPRPWPFTGLSGGGTAARTAATIEVIGARTGVTGSDHREDDGRVARTGATLHMDSAKNSKHPTPDERAAVGKAARKKASRASHDAWSAGQRTHDPLTLLLEQEESRVPELVPIRHGRMASSAFAFYRGAALPMAADLSTTPTSGLRVQLCGDAHLPNFGGFGTPERELIFDLNDFDETAPGPFEWDVKRLAASVEIAGRSRGFDGKWNRKIVTECVRSYRETIRRFSLMHNLDLWYSRLDLSTVLALWGAEAGQRALKRLQQSVAKAETKDSLKARDKLTAEVDGELRFLSDPPLLVPVEELAQPDQAQVITKAIHEAIRSYRRTLDRDRQHLLDGYSFAGLARKVVGVGSVGTRCWVSLFVGRDHDDVLFLQVKEAEDSVLERFTGKSVHSNHGQRVVEGQRLMQAASDILLGWQRVVAPDGETRDFYMRQLWDWKASALVDVMEPETLFIYAGMCAWTLARGLARSGDAIAIGSYLGSGTTFDNAVAAFASAYADQNDDDHQSLVAAIQRGTVPAEREV
jgi:uncharacterized protein (DUF2252 family)